MPKLSTIPDIAAIVAVAIGILAFYRTIRNARRMNNAPYFERVFGIARDTIFKEIEKFGKYSIQTREKLLGLDIGEMLKDVPPRVFLDAVERHANAIDRIRAEMEQRSLYRLEAYDKKAFEVMNSFPRTYSLSYDRRLRKAILRIYRDGKKLRRPIEHYNELVTPLTHQVFVGGAIGAGISSEIAQSVTRTLKEYVGDKTNIQDLAMDRRFRRDLAGARKEILKLTGKTTKYYQRIAGIVQFYSLKYDISAHH